MIEFKTVVLPLTEVKVKKKKLHAVETGELIVKPIEDTINEYVNNGWEFVSIEVVSGMVQRKVNPVKKALSFKPILFNEEKFNLLIFKRETMDAVIIDEPEEKSKHKKKHGKEKHQVEEKVEVTEEVASEPTPIPVPVPEIKEEVKEPEIIKEEIAPEVVEKPIEEKVEIKPEPVVEKVEEKVEEPVLEVKEEVKAPKTIKKAKPVVAKKINKVDNGEVNTPIDPIETNKVDDIPEQSKSDFDTQDVTLPVSENK